jgi:16S rRNA processing protein RimM
MVSGGEPDGSREWLIVGVVTKPHGVHGDLVVQILTDFPERLQPGVRFGLGPEDGPVELHTAFAVRYHRGQWLLGIDGLRSRDDVEPWRGRYVFLPEQALDELPEGYFYEHHLAGLECRSPSGEVLGVVSGVDPGAGGQSRLVVRRGQREFLVPYVDAIVRGVDLEAGVVTVDPIPGLLDDDADTA